MDELAIEGFVVLGGPLGEDEERFPPLIMDAEAEQAIRGRALTRTLVADEASQAFKD